MSTYTRQGFMGNGLIPMASNQLSVNTKMSYLNAAVSPAASGHYNTTNIVPVVSQAGGYVHMDSSGDLYQYGNRYAYAWTVNVTEIDHPRGTLPPPLDSGYDTKQVSTVFALAMSEQTANNLEIDRDHIQVFFPLHLTKEAVQDGQDDTGDCHQTLGEECAKALTLAVNRSPHGIPVMPEECKDVLGETFVAGNDSQASTYSGSVSGAFSNLPRELVAQSELEHGFAMISAGDYSVTPGNKDATQFNTINWALRFDHSALAFEGGKKHNSGFPTRSAIFSRAFMPVDAFDKKVDDNYYIALRAVQPVVVSQVGHLEGEPAKWSSLMCLQAKDIQPGHKELKSGKGYGHGYAKNGASARNVGMSLMMVMGAVASMLLI